MGFKITTRKFSQLTAVLWVYLWQAVNTKLILPNQLFQSRTLPTIVVSNGGNDSEECWENFYLPCKSLGFALLKSNLNNTLVLMEGGIHNLSKRIELKNVHNFSLQGETPLYLSSNNSETNVSIRCIRNGAGLTFKLSANLSFNDFEINSCGSEHLSTSRSAPQDPRKSNFSLVWTAMYFERCLHMTFHRVKLSNNFGMGAVMYDVGGTMDFVNVSFQKNLEKKYFLTVTDFYPMPEIFVPGLASGGGLYIEFTLHSEEDPSMAYFVSNSEWTFKNCSFVENTAEHEYSRLSVEGQNYISFGRGGGISIILRGNASKNTFTMDGCSFVGNVALWGAGLFLEFHDNAQNNSMTVSHSYFGNNSATYGGGAIRVGTTIQQLSTGNNVTVKSSHITRNRAKVGGGFSQYRLSNVGMRDETTHIKSCTFDENFAVIGSAIHLIFTHMHCTDSSITKNTGCSFDDECSDLIGQGSVYCSKSELSLRGNNELRYNEHSAIILDASMAVIHNNTTLVNNSGLDGGAVGLYGYSVVRLTRYSQVNFINNTASKKGGAIYFDGAGPPLAPFNSTEFIMYNYSCAIVLGDHDIDDAEPDTFPATINFMSNVASASSGNAIFATSVAGCRRSGDKKYNNSALRWSIFNYSQNEEPAIVTSPIKIETNQHYWRAIPGRYFQPKVVLRDEHWNSVYGTIRVTVKHVIKGWVHISGSNLFVVKDKITGIAMRGTENAKFSLLLETVTEVPVQYWIYNLTLGNCRLGFYLTENGKCECLASHKGLSNGVTHCSGDDVYILKGRWVDPYRDHNSGSTMEFANHICPRHYCNADCITSNATDGVDCLFQVKKQCAKYRKWDSILCGACQDRYSVKFGTEDCDICKNTNIFFILLLMLALSLFVLFVLFLNINTYSTYLNAFLYSYQIIPLIYGFRLPGQHQDPFISVVAFISGFAGSGDAKIGVCLWDGMTDINKIAFNYFVPIYIVAFTAGVAKLSAYLDGKEVGKKVEKLRRWLFDKDASLHAFAFIAVVAYSDITRITLMLLCPSKVHSKWVMYYAGDISFFSTEHLYYAIPAFFVTFFVLCFPVVVMFPFLITGYFTKLQGIFDALQYCFK